MKYAQTGIRSFIPPGGACMGHRYEDRPDKGDPHMSIDCGRCEPFLAADPLWAGSPGEVPLTAQEQKQADAAEQVFNKVAAQSVAALAAALAGGGLTLAQVPGAIPQGALPAAQPAAVPAPEPAPAVEAPAKPRPPRSRGKAPAGTTA